MIDIHAHVFNAGYLPLRGIFESRGVPSFIAKRLARILEAAVQDEELQPRSWAKTFRSHSEKGLEGEFDWGALVPLGADPITAYAMEAPAALLESHAEDIEEALEAAELESGGGANALSSFEVASKADQAIEVDLLARPAGELRWKLRRLLYRVASLARQGLALVNWVILLLKKESTLVNELLDTYPEGELFVHHTMDMAPHYPGRSLYPYDDLQLRRARALVEQSGGRLLAFVAFSPFREKDAHGRSGLDLVKECLHRGYAGVKFYPPSGYRPIGNTARDLDGTGQDPKTIDERNLALFRYCVEHDIPIFSHCQPGEMERWPGAGCLSSPDGWADVLGIDGLGDLRLCLGHAGGEGWTAPPGAEDDEGMKRCAGTRFISGVVDLCVRYPNVYCEFGCMHGVMEAEGRDLFAARLAGYVREYGDGVSRKVIYGSDWHMLAQGPVPEDFDDAFRAAFNGHDEIRRYADRFFRYNALRYLNLAGYLERNQGRVSEREREYLSALMIKNAGGDRVST